MQSCNFLINRTTDKMEFIFCDQNISKLIPTFQLVRKLSFTIFKQVINFFNCYPCKCEFSLYRCYECDDEVLADKFKKVSECMEHLKKLACVPTLDLALGKLTEKILA